MTAKPLVAVTGASSGIGEATVRAFSAAGHPVLLMARRIERLEAMRLPNSVCRQVDVRDRAILAAAVRDAEVRFIPITRSIATRSISSMAYPRAFANTSSYDVRVIVISPRIIETEVLDGVKDPVTLANYRASKSAIGDGIEAEYVADLILGAYNLPQNSLVQEICVTPTRQKY